MRVSRALISVDDKRGIADFGLGLKALNIGIVASAGTRTRLAASGVEAVPTRDVTDYSDSFLGGRVKTLQARIHAAILADRNDAEHLRQLEREAIKPIDLVCVNLYGERGLPESHASHQREAISQIDIGGPVMIRTAALNYQHVAVLVSREDYAPVLETLAEYDNSLPESMLATLASKAFDHVAEYETSVARWFRDHVLPAADDDVTA